MTDRQFFIVVLVLAIGAFSVLGLAIYTSPNTATVTCVQPIEPPLSRTTGINQP
jgi:hypothetical protein